MWLVEGGGVSGKDVAANYLFPKTLGGLYTGPRAEGGVPFSVLPRRARASM